MSGTISAHYNYGIMKLFMILKYKVVDWPVDAFVSPESGCSICIYILKNIRIIFIYLCIFIFIKKNIQL